MVKKMFLTFLVPVCACKTFLKFLFIQLTFEMLFALFHQGNSDFNCNVSETLQSVKKKPFSDP